MNVNFLTISSFFFNAKGRRQQVTLCLLHKVGRVLSFFSSRRNWDAPNPSPAGECAHPPVRWGGAHSLAREGLGESEFRRGDIHCGTLYIYVICGLLLFYSFDARLRPPVSKRVLSSERYKGASLAALYYNHEPTQHMNG
jgi:hypothetical protein